MSPPLSRDLIRRLAFVRYLFEMGLDQSHQPEPFGAVSLLTFHDACEMFLQIAAEHRAVNLKPKSDFMEYWSAFEQNNLSITARTSMTRFNKARVSMKHSGVLPHKADIDGFRATITTFFEDNSPNLLGIELHDVTLTSMITFDGVREPLERAEAALASGDPKSALEEIAIAFVLSLRRYEGRRRGDGAPLDRLYSLRSTGRLFGFGIEREGKRELELTLRRMTDAFTEAITVVAYNLDFDSYIMFKTYAPVVHEIPGGSPVIEWTWEPTTDPVLVRRCVNFVVNTAIRLEAIN
ncbi:hypothetical protein [Bradyrhizobium sp. SZCCHNR1015]|uniref:hypothetical protein n=1 Tax=Bradyrhizobium sp. SZCCHNR1015 TaxID=3057338 RepID=UPI0029170A34|nr:hypothetical protein [Bradyrhizobium sp. SZCCHNR1015]